jgi:enoyl-CoA hydratase/carnithine racemase
MDYSKYQTVKVDIQGNIMLLSLNRPEKLNAWNNELIDEMYEITTKLKEDKDISVVLLTGEGTKGFCGGLDVKNVFLPEVYNSVSNLYDSQLKMGNTILNMRQMPQIIVAACFGACVGGGFIYAMASDIRIIANDVRFSAPFVKIKMGGADLGTSYFLPRQIGAGVSYDLLLTGRFMLAEEAMRLGFASECVEPEKIREAAMAKAQELAAIDSMTLRLTKETLNVNLDLGNLEACMMVEHRNQQMIFSKLWRKFAGN